MQAMQMMLRWAAPMVGVAIAGAIWAAPTALAQPDEPSCTDVGGTDTCESPGNVQIDASPPVDFAPQYPYWEGDSVIGIPDEGGGDLVGLGPARR
jgi:hypothetical protein